VRSYEPVTLNQVEEGKFLEDLEHEFAALQNKLCLFANQYGERADKSVAELVIKLKLGCVSAKDGMYVIKSEIVQKTPPRPAHVSMAIQAEDDEGNLRLFAQPQGTADEDPHQTRLALDGNVIPETDTDGVIVE